MQFMAMNPSQYYAVNNHAYLGHAAAYHVRCRFAPCSNELLKYFALPGCDYIYRLRRELRSTGVAGQGADANVRAN